MLNFYVVSNRCADLELAIQLRVEKLSEYELLKITLLINRKENLKLSNDKIIYIVKNSDNNINLLLNSLQSIINNTENTLGLLEDICNILKKKNIKNYPQIKQILNKVLIFNSYDIYFIINYIYNKIISDIKNKPEFIAYVASLNNSTNNIVKNIIILDTFIFYIYKMLV